MKSTKIKNPRGLVLVFGEKKLISLCKVRFSKMIENLITNHKQRIVG